MSRVETNPSSRGRRSFATPARSVATLFGIAALVGLANCADDPVSPHSESPDTELPPPRFPRFSAGENPDSLPPGSFFVTMPAQGNTGAFAKYVFAFYGAKTRVEMVAAGVIGKTRITTQQTTWISPLGHGINGSCYSYVVVDFRKANNLFGGGWPQSLCNANTRLTDTIVFEGTGTVRRESGYAYAGFGCGATYQSPCFTYSGEHSVRLRPVAKQLELVVDSSQVKSGSQVRFTARHKEGRPVTVRLWLWKPLSPVVGANGSTTYGPTASGCNQSLPTCDAVMTNTQPPEDPATTQRGLMYVQAVVDGVEEVAKVEVKVFRDLPPVVVNLPSGESTVPPVFSRFFSGVTQTWTGHLYPSDARRRDVIELPVSAVFDTMYYDWVRIHFSSSVADGSGGHPHGLPGGSGIRRLSGSFFATLGLAETTQGRTLDTATVELRGTTTSDTIFYRTSGVAGIEMVAMTATAKPKGTTQPLQVKSGVKSAAIRLSGLSALPWEGTHYRFSDQGHTRHGNINNYINPSFSANLVAAFEEYAALYDGAQLPRFIVDPETGVLETKFVINDASLEWGGLLDSGSPEWANPHRLHRTGEDVDVRIRVFDDRRERRFMRICKARPLKCEVHTEPRHFHIQPASRSAP